MKKIVLAVVLAIAASAAHAANTTVSIVINSPASTSVSCSPGTLTAPVAANTVVCPISVVPSGWSGALTLSGTNASSFALSGTNLVVGASALSAGTYSVTITATP